MAIINAWYEITYIGYIMNRQRAALNVHATVNE